MFNIMEFDPIWTNEPTHPELETGQKITIGLSIVLLAVLGLSIYLIAN